MIDSRLPPTALLVVAHGDGGADPRDETVRRLAERLAKRLDLPVDWATLKRPETFAEAHARLGAAAARVAVYPLFMANGFFVRVKLPKLLGESGFGDTEILPVFGLDPRLIDLIEHRLRSIASMQGGREPKDFSIALIAHGSGSGDAGSRLASEAIAADLGYRLDTRLHLGFIEEAPFFEEVIGASAEIVVGLFVSAGTHALDDVAACVAKTPSVLHHVATVGDDAGVADMVEAALATLVRDRVA
ncbi:sirohydrochlorin chelatase [Pinisolibacter sp.]|uniref:sirohydrochlorin chelatase n=1 Tax=Pinisolibacter sp. TaxID=2172024 RepID=UPI002FDC7AC3